MLVLATGSVVWAQAVPVELVHDSQGNWRLLRGGELYFAEGAGVGGQKTREALENLAAAGGNSLRTWGIAADTDHTWTKFPVAKLEDYKGRKLGASGSLSLWANGIGAVAVQGDFATHYNNVKTGVYDGLIAFTTGVYPIKIHEVAPYMTKVNLGATSIGAITINKKLFDSMSPETQKIFRDVGAEYSQRVSATMKTLAGVFEKKMAAEGAKISDFPAAERKKWATTMPNIAKDWVNRNEDRGEPAKKVLEAYMAKLRANKVELVRDWDKE